MPERSASLRARVGAHVPELRPIAEDVLAAVSRIDLVALDERGVAHVVIEAARGGDAAALTHAIAASAWLTSRLADWVQLAPAARIDPATPARAVVAAESFHPDTRAVAALLGDELVRLIELAPGRPAEESTAADRPPSRTHSATSSGEAPRTAPAPGAARAATARAAEAPRAAEVGGNQHASTPPVPAASDDATSSRFRTGLSAADLGFATP